MKTCFGVLSVNQQKLGPGPLMKKKKKKKKKSFSILGILNADKMA